MTAKALTPIDGRYANDVADLAEIVSEFGLMKYRVQVMAAWVVFLERQGVAAYDCDVETTLQGIVKNFSDADYDEIKEIEYTTNHDVKAVEYFLRTKLPKTVWSWIHFACTSEDVNNVSYALMYRDAVKVCKDALQLVTEDLNQKAINWRMVSMLARTHGQAATPVTAGKEMAVFAHRLETLTAILEAVPNSAKWNGATGNYAAHMFAFPKVDWITLSKTFIQSFGLHWNHLTTQIEGHDMKASSFNAIGQIYTIFVDFCNDVWAYISIEYMGQMVVATETGSSAMPGKINPINIENARGNFKTARALGRLMAEELPISTWQRDLSDSTMQRNMGTMFGHFLLALVRVKKGLDRIVLRPDQLNRDLERNPGVLGEGIQTMMRKHGDPDAYEKLKDFQRGKDVSLKEFHDFIRSLQIPEDDRKRLLALRPKYYIGASEELVFALD